MCDLRMFEIASDDFRSVKILFTTSQADEGLRRICCYHLQQCVEKVLKGFLDFTGVKYEKTHSIGTLINITDNSASKCLITEWLRRNENVLTKWEGTARYPSSLCIELREAAEAISEVKNFLRENGICDKLLPEITADVQAKLTDTIPLSDRPRSNLEWNVLYRLFLWEKPKKAKSAFDMNLYFKEFGVIDKTAEVARLKMCYATEDMSVIKKKAEELYYSSILRKELGDD